MMVESAISFAFENHTEDIFIRSIDYINEIGLDMSCGIISTPFPGTENYNILYKDGRILTEDWSKYDGRHLLYKHENFTEEELLEGIKTFEKEAYSLKRIYKYYKFVSKLAAKAY